MIKAILIDDEVNCTEMLKWDLAQNCPNVEVLTTCNSGKDGLKAIKDLQPDLVFLDIDMPYMSGFEMLELVNEVNFDVIFTTAYDEYAVKAFKISAVDYLLKPVDEEDLTKAVAKVAEKQAKNEKPQHIEFLKEQLVDTKANAVKRIALPTYEGLMFLNMETIIYCQSDNNYCNVFLKDGRKLLISRTLKDIEDMLNGFHFFRVHNSFLVNLNEIS